MYEIVEDEYNQFLRDIVDGSMIFGRYVDSLGNVFSEIEKWM